MVKAKAKAKRASTARARAREGAWTSRRSASWPTFLHLLEAALEELPLATLLDRQLEELLEGSSTSHLQVRLLEVSPAPWSEELPVPVPPTLLPTGSATSSAEVGREERVEREAKAGRLLVSLEGREGREEKARAREERVARAFSEGSTAKAKERVARAF